MSLIPGEQAALTRLRERAEYHRALAKEQQTPEDVAYHEKLATSNDTLCDAVERLAQENARLRELMLQQEHDHADHLREVEHDAARYKAALEQVEQLLDDAGMPTSELTGWSWIDEQIYKAWRIITAALKEEPCLSSTASTEHTASSPTSGQQK